jgi:hypothetical protein
MVTWVLAPHAAMAQEGPGLATLEVRQGVVQWFPVDAPDWEAATSGQTVQARDRVRTDGQSSARLVFQDDSTTTVNANTGVRIDRLERAKGGGLYVRLFHAAGATLHRAQQAADAGGAFAVETPAATVWVHGHIGVIQWPLIDGCEQPFVILNEPAWR